MITGRRAFEGKTTASTIAAILASEPKPISSMQPMTPPTLDRVVTTSLAKDPDERFQTVHDLKLQLKWISETAPSTAPRTIRAARERWIWISVVAIPHGSAACLVHPRFSECFAAGVVLHSSSGEDQPCLF